MEVQTVEQFLVEQLNKLVPGKYTLASTNTKASSEWFSKRGDPGPVPTYSDEYRRRVRESTDVFLNVLNFGLESGRIKSGDPILGGVFPHPDPKEAPESEVERDIHAAYARIKKRKATATVVPSNSTPVQLKKIRKRKTQSRKRGK